MAAHGAALLTVQLVLLGAGGMAAALGPGWSTVQRAADFLGPKALERKEHHLARAWAAIDGALSLSPHQRQVPTKRAHLHAVAALSEGPANGYGWLALAWAAMLDLREDAALDALRQSWRWAPQSRGLAMRRVVLASRLWHRLDHAERAHLLAELRHARNAGPAAFLNWLAADRRLAALWRIAVAQRLDRGARPVRQTHLHARLERNAR